MKDFIKNNIEKFTVRNSEMFDGLSIYKYSRRTYQDKNTVWDSRMNNMRGVILDEDHNIVALPFARMAKYTTNTISSDRVTYVRKVNGFMASVTYSDRYGLPIIATTGSMDSAYVEYARHIIPQEAIFTIMKLAIDQGKSVTHVFEIVHPEDPHVIPEQVGAYYLGQRGLSWDSVPKMEFEDQIGYDELALEMCVLRPEWYSGVAEEKEILYWKDKSIAEGGVIWDNGVGWKCKSDYYNTIKLVGRTPDPFTKDFKHTTPHLAYILESLGSTPEARTFFIQKDEQERFAIIRKLLNDLPAYN